MRGHDVISVNMLNFEDLEVGTVVSNDTVCHCWTRNVQSQVLVKIYPVQRLVFN